MVNTNEHPTAYPEGEARVYERKRFSSRGGALFHELEVGQILKSLSRMWKPRRMLEVGCGTGRLLREVESQAHWAVGVDPSHGMLAEAVSAKRKPINCDYTISDGAALPFREGAFDFVYCVRVLNQVQSKTVARNVIMEAVRVTFPQGITLIEFVNRRGLTRTQGRQDAVFLTFEEMREVVDECSQAVLADERGILMMTQTVLEVMPNLMRQPVLLLDRYLSTLFPQYASRAYAEIRRRQRDTG